jgi:sorting nexin-8
LAVNGHYLSADAAFLERRRRGLSRFANAIVRHPVLSQEQLVIMFLTVPTELSVWRKQANLSVQEEFSGKALPPGLEERLPQNLENTFDMVRSGLRKSSEIYIQLCNLVERLEKRQEGIAADYMRFSGALRSLTDVSEATYAVDTSEIPLLNDGLTAVAKHLSQSQSLIEDETKAWDQGVLEDLKRQRDCLISMRELFERKDRYAVDNIPQLERRIKQNEAKLEMLRHRTEPGKPGEEEKVQESISRDKKSIVDQHARGVLIKECIRDELVYFQNSQYHVARLHQDWSQERVKYAELHADNWRSLCNEAEGMPLGE